MKTKKMILVLVAVSVTVLCGVSMAGSKINAWVIDDFESYDSTVGGSSPMKAYDLTSGGPWFILQELQVALGMNGLPDPTIGIIPTNGLLEIELVGSPTDPNGFLAAHETDADGAKAVKVHYDFSTASDNTGTGQNYWSCDLFTLTSNLGVPFGIFDTSVIPGHPLPFAPVVDFTKYDKLTLKIKNGSNNTSNRNSFGLAFIGPDLESIGYMGAVGDSVDLLNYPERRWVTLEFNLNDFPDEGASLFGLDNVMGVVLGMGDTIGSGEKVTVYIDEIMLYNESGPCDTYKPGDINLDCQVNLLDLAELAAGWMM